MATSKTPRRVEWRVCVDPAVLNDGHGSNAVELSISHDRGGPNYFSGGTEPAGYQFSITPIEQKDGHTRFVIGANVGRRYMIERTKAPFSAKRLAAHVERIAPATDAIVRALIAREYDAIRLFVMPPDLTTPEPAPVNDAVCGICDQPGNSARSCRYCSARSWRTEPGPVPTASF